MHVYTSPHLVRFHERIELAGASGKAHADRRGASSIDVLVRTQATNGTDDITQFEITTAAAFLAFAEQPADVLLLEVGLGGRLDATNVIDRPALSIITPISLDHSEKLGSTLAKIAYEKAGILRPGVPVVIAQQEEEAEEVIRARPSASARRSFVWGEHFDAYRAARPARRADRGTSSSTCRCRRSLAATRSSMPAPRLPRRCSCARAFPALAPR